jgi:hypothetical protein
MVAVLFRDDTVSRFKRHFPYHPSFVSTLPRTVSNVSFDNSIDSFALLKHSKYTCIAN